MLTCNARCVVAIESEEFGEVLFAAIGAKEVGTVKYVTLNLPSFYTDPSSYWLLGANVYPPW